MILDGILSVLQGFLGVILSPLDLFEVGLDFLGSISFVQQFLQVIAYVLPWSNLTPIFVFVFGLFAFRTALALIKLIWRFIPIIGN